MSGSNMSDLQSLETSRLLFHIDVNWSVFAGKESQRDWNEQEVGYIYDAGTGILLIRASQFLSTIAWFFVCPVTRKWASPEIWKATFEWFTASGYSVPGCHTWTYLCQLNLNIFFRLSRDSNFLLICCELVCLTERNCTSHIWNGLRWSDIWDMYRLKSLILQPFLSDQGINQIWKHLFMWV